MDSTMTMFERYQGLSGIEQLVREFYRDVLAEPELAVYFKGHSVESIIQHQIDLFCHIMGGPCSFEMERLESAHRPLKIPEAHFDWVARILVENLEDAGFRQQDIDELAGIVMSVKPVVVHTP